MSRVLAERAVLPRLVIWNAAVNHKIENSQCACVTRHVFVKRLNPAPLSEKNPEVVEREER